MTIILGIDAAWTEGGTSGVALLRTSNGQRRLIAAAPSYDSFVTDEATTASPFGSPDIAAILRKAREKAGSAVDVVAIDMPVARRRIDGRRVSDDAVSKAFGRFGAAVHSPTPIRPGAHGRGISRALEKAGYPLVTTDPRSGHATIEVFPLAALIRMMKLDYRPAYKISKISRYWRNEVPTPTTVQKIGRLLDTWSSIIDALSGEIRNFQYNLPKRQNLTAGMLKPHEDKLDAIISAWVGACFVEGSAELFGDRSSAIWIPRYKDSEI
jgi:predicted RNase H-like nuclease